MRKIKQTAAWLSVVLILGVLALLGLRAYSSRMWESTMLGPFEGLPFDYVLSSHPVSALRLDENRELAIYEVADVGVPILVIRQNGEPVWRRLMEPRQVVNGKELSAGLYDARLLRIHDIRQGCPVILFNCYWTWGGQENGLIYLNQDYSFRSFAISW